MIGSLGGVLFQKLAGYVVKWTDSYVVLFVISGLAYVTALLVLRILSPRLSPAKLERTRESTSFYRIGCACGRSLLAQRVPSPRAIQRDHA